METALWSTTPFIIVFNFELLIAGLSHGKSATRFRARIANRYHSLRKLKQKIHNADQNHIEREGGHKLCRT